MIYLIGSLRNPEVPHIGNWLRSDGHEVFDDWVAAGEIADQRWQEYETLRGRSFGEALQGAAAKNVFQFDKRHLDAADMAVLVMPAGKSGHLELGYMIGRGKPSFVLFDQEPERYDVMYQFATGVYFNLGGLREAIHAITRPHRASTRRLAEPVVVSKAIKI